MNYTPCHGCPERVVGCHGKCEKYAAYRQEHDERLTYAAILESGKRKQLTDSLLKSRAHAWGKRCEKFNRKEIQS